jgi:hypothetical protein
VYFCGRLAQYKYLNTDEVIGEALQCFDRIRAACPPDIAAFSRATGAGRGRLAGGRLIPGPVADRPIPDGPRVPAGLAPGIGRRGDDSRAGPSPPP